MAGPMELVTTDRTVGSTRLARLVREVSHLGGPEAAADPERRPAYRALAQSVRALILDGRIALRTRVPAERDLAAALGLSRTTVTAAYDLLREEGFLESRRGSGTWTMLPPGAGPAGFGGWLLPSQPGGADVAIDLSCASFGMPAALMTEVLAECAPAIAALTANTGYYHAGWPELREVIAERYCARGLPTTPDQIVITSGAQHGNVLALGLLCGPGDRVVVESPTYPNSIEAMRRARMRPVPVPIGEDGIESDVLAAQLRQAAPRVAYLIPDFQNPTGALMSQERRAEAAEAARAAGTWIINDETVSDMALDVPTPPPFPASVSRAAAEQVISVGSMSKSHWGGLRIGWIRTSPRMATELAGQRVAMDMAGSVLDQIIAVALLRRGQGVVEERLTLLRRQRAALEQALAAELPDWSWRTPPGGLSLWVDLGEPSSSELAGRAAAFGVRVVGGPQFGVDPGTFEHRIRIPYTLPEDTLREAVRRLASAFRCETALPPLPDENRWVA
ncbi:PLP-dependent aminotransferase family protein [Catenulispora yoronensis]|uniref:PLP-dependent aminotransferase family protein n=1 Tax=Catenulispora yoronensis TaxID=450799 RepID=A0ABP5GR16_9ACTN